MMWAMAERRREVRGTCVREIGGRGFLYCVRSLSRRDKMFQGCKKSYSLRRECGCHFLSLALLASVEERISARAPRTVPMDYRNGGLHACLP